MNESIIFFFTISTGMGEVGNISHYLIISHSGLMESDFSVRFRGLNNLEGRG